MPARRGRRRYGLVRTLWTDDGGGFVDPNQIVATYEREVGDLAARAEEAKERIKQLIGTATSQDGAVTVTVSGGGALRSISFGPRADELPRERLAAEIMATARQAQGTASQQILEIMSPLLGDDSDAMRFVREQIPEPVEPEEEVRESYPGLQPFDDEPPAAPPRPARPRRPALDDDDDDFGMGSPLNREGSW
jgi:DNA-binding protein YbaB